MRDGWRDVRLGDLIEPTLGGVWGEDAPFSDALAVRSLRGIDLAGFNDFLTPDVPKRWVTEKQLRTRRLEVGDLVLEGSGTNCGRSVIVSDEMLASQPDPLVFSNFCRRFRVDSEQVLPSVLGRLLALAYRQGEIQTYRTGSAMPNLDVNTLTDRFRVSLPPLAVQVQIEGVMSKLDALIAQDMHLRAQVERKGIAFVEQLTSPSGDDSYGWPTVTLAEATSVIEVGKRPKGGVKGINAGVPSIGAESINGLGVFDYAKTRFVPEDFAAAMKKGRLQSRDVLVYKDGGKPGDFRPHVGMFGDGYPYERAVINEHVYRVRAVEGLTESYLFFWLSTDAMMRQMRLLGTGAAIPGINSTALKSLPVPMPPDSVKATLFPVLDSLVTEALAAVKEARNVILLRDALLGPLLSGQISVDLEAA
jgi:type I restriction enzyme S subunit